MGDTIRWGILGPGNIAKKFALGLQAAEDAELVAVASRSQERADAFGDEFGATRRYDNYAALANDAAVDAVYIATPHVGHKDATILCLKGGRHVLCEKPFAINAAEVEEMIAVAQSEKRFLMEAMWSRFIPSYVAVRKLLAENAIGEPRMVTANFGFRADVNPDGRLFDLALGGGALLDVGIYPVAFAAMVFGAEPAGMVSQAHLGETGVDEQNAIIMRYENGALALLSSAIRTNSQNFARIDGTDGAIQIESPFWCSETITVTRGGETEAIPYPLRGNGYEYEAEEVGACIRAGALESETMSLAESLQITRTLESIRTEWGLTYPAEA